MAGMKPLNLSWQGMQFSRIFGKSSRSCYACCDHVRKTKGSSEIFILWEMPHNVYQFAQGHLAEKSTPSIQISSHAMTRYRECRRCHATNAFYFSNIKYMVTMTVGRSSMVPWLWFQTEKYCKYCASVIFVIYLVNECNSPASCVFTHA